MPDSLSTHIEASPTAMDDSSSHQVVRGTCILEAANVLDDLHPGHLIIFRHDHKNRGNTANRIAPDGTHAHLFMIWSQPNIALLVKDLRRLLDKQVVDINGLYHIDSSKLLIDKYLEESADGYGQSADDNIAFLRKTVLEPVLEDRNGEYAPAVETIRDILRPGTRILLDPHTNAVRQLFWAECICIDTRSRMSSREDGYILDRGKLIYFWPDFTAGLSPAAIRVLNSSWTYQGKILCPACMGYDFVHHGLEIAAEKKYDRIDLLHSAASDRCREINRRRRQLGYLQIPIQDVFNVVEPEEWQAYEVAIGLGSPNGLKPALRSRIKSLQSTEYSVIEAKREQNANNSCALCQRIYENGEMIATMPCTHQCHLGCIVSWLRRYDYCPQCGFQLTGIEAKTKAENISVKGVSALEASIRSLFTPNM